MLKLKRIEEIKNLAFEKKDVIEKYLLKKNWDNYNYQRNVQQKFNKNFKK
jgi:phosphate starvation-inducible protein PhoH